MPVLASILAVILYAAGLYVSWRHFKQRQSGRALLGIIMAALFCHGAAVYYHLIVPNGLNLSLLTVSDLVAFVLVVMVAIANLRLPIENLYLIVLPISIVVIIATNLAPASTPLTDLSTSLVAHILVSLAAYSALMMAACQSVVLAVQERQLKSHGPSVLGLLPPLETMERLLVAMLWIGLILLSGAILSGYLFLEDIFARQVLHHIVLTSLSWCLYVAFLVGHHLFGWRGLTAVRWTLVAFGLLVLGYLGSKFVLEYVLVR